MTMPSLAPPAASPTRWMVEMFDVKTAAPTVNQPSDLLARKYWFVRGMPAEPHPDPKGGDADQVCDNDGEIDRIEVHQLFLFLVVFLPGRSTYHRSPAPETSKTLE